MRRDGAMDRRGHVQRVLSWLRDGAFTLEAWAVGLVVIAIVIAIVIAVMCVYIYVYNSYS